MCYLCSNSMTLYNILEYYHHRDHLGNNCVVWNATNNSIAQRTWYYASGTPMSISTTQGAQPYKYNGKEYVESHGYDTYDYGFRGYYATIGRFTSIDPLTERTPWQSPYAYANNNWVNLIDYMGLAGSDAYTTSDQAKISKLLEYMADGGDLQSYDFNEEGWEEGMDLDWWFNEGIWLLLNGKDSNQDGVIVYINGDGFASEISVTGNRINKNSIQDKAKNIELEAFLVVLNIGSKESALFREMRIGDIAMYIAILQLFNDIADIHNNGPNVQNMFSITKDAIALIPNIYVQMGIIAMDTYILMFDILSNQVMQLENRLNDMDYWKDVYMTGSYF